MAILPQSGEGGGEESPQFYKEAYSQPSPLSHGMASLGPDSPKMAILPQSGEGGGEESPQFYKEAYSQPSPLSHGMASLGPDSPKMAILPQSGEGGGEESPQFYKEAYSQPCGYHVKMHEFLPASMRIPRKNARIPGSAHADTT
jgi:hypothetical protein